MKRKTQTNKIQKYNISEQQIHKVAKKLQNSYLLQCQIPNFVKFKNKFRQNVYHFNIFR